ncbi:MAG: amidohydrolase [Rhodothermales bacterium]|nr:amidohydrolase [Rhodothermales bacterium]
MPIPTVNPDLRNRLVSFRRDVHQHPELSWKEHRTATRIEAQLDELGIPHRRLTETGIIADLPGPAGVPVVALRADMDALPIHEETGLPFTSTNDGVMHACGHDGHMSMVLGAAALLAKTEGLPAPVRFIFQPAEELGVGAEAMVMAGALKDVACIFGGHVDRHYPTGAIVVSDGTVNASTDQFEIAIHGQEAHAARPHEAIDAVVVGSLMVMSLQTIVSREVDPAHPSVVSVGRFTAGTAANVIAGRAYLSGTIRAQEASVREHLRRSLKRMADSIALLHECAIEVEFTDHAPPVINDAAMASLAREAAAATSGAHVTELHTPNMGAEDFSFYLQERPGCYVRFGAQVEGRESFPAHSSRFDIDEDVLPIGAEYFARIALMAGSRLAGNALLKAS